MGLMTRQANAEAKHSEQQALFLIIINIFFCSIFIFIFISLFFFK